MLVVKLCHINHANALIICCHLSIGEMKCVRDEGMPRYKNPYEKGRLIITFSVRLLYGEEFMLLWLCITTLRILSITQNRPVRPVHSKAESIVTQTCSAEYQSMYKYYTVVDLWDGKILRKRLISHSKPPSWPATFITNQK